MADNSLRTSSGSESIVTREVSHGGDTSKIAGSFIVGISGTEGSYTYEAIDGSAANGLEVDVTRVQGTVTVDGSGVTQPVSGTVTANLSAVDNAVLDAIAASVAGTLTVDGSGVTQPVSIAGTVTVDLGANNDVTLATLPDTSAGDLAAINAAVSGTLTVGTHAVTQSGSWAVTANAGTNLNTSALALESGGNLAAIATDMAAIEVLLTTIEGNQLADGHNVTIDNASIAVTASSLPLPTGAATAANQSTANSSLSTIAGDTTSLDAKIATYTTADFDTGTGTSTVTINGIALPGSGGPVVGGTASNPIVVDFGANNDVTVTGSVTANAGTNLNTSLLALESGGNLATIAGDTTSLDGKVTACNTGDVTISSSALPSGAATASNQSTIIGHVDGIETLLGTIDADTGSIATDASTIAGDTTSIDSKITACNTGAVVISSSALPTGAATAANQSTANGLLTTIDADTGNIATSTALSATAISSVGTFADNTKAIVVAGYSGFNAEVPYVAFSGWQLAAENSTHPLFVYTSGNVAHDAAIGSNFSGQPTLTGGYASAAAPSNVSADGDAVRAWHLRNGAQCVNITAAGALIPGDATNGLDVDITRLSAATTGGATPYKLISAATTNATSVKASAGQIYGIQVYNTNAAARYLKIYNKASAPTVGTDTPVKVITIPGNTAGAGSNVAIPACGIAFGTGIAFATTTGAADSDTGAVAANEVIINLDYK